MTLRVELTGNENLTRSTEMEYNINETYNKSAHFTTQFYSKMKLLIT